MKCSTVAGLVVLPLGACACAPHPGGDVPFLVTPPEVVEQMLKLARVGPADVVYDLGSGDGRLVIAAAREATRHGSASSAGFARAPCLWGEVRKGAEPPSE